MRCHVFLSHSAFLHLVRVPARSKLSTTLLAPPGGETDPGVEHGAEGALPAEETGDGRPLSQPSSSVVGGVDTEGGWMSGHLTVTL